jgi:hypothetical protein
MTVESDLSYGMMIFPLSMTQSGDESFRRNNVPDKPALAMLLPEREISTPVKHSMTSRTTANKMTSS